MLALSEVEGSKSEQEPIRSTIMARKDTRFEGLPEIAAVYIKRIVRRVRNTRRIRREVCQELIDHFTDALHDCTDDEARDWRAAELIEEFGDTRLLGKLIRRGKKRCRPLWKKALIRSFQTVGALFILLCLYTWWLNTGTPTISVDYVAIVNDRACPKIPDAENAWEDYKRAIELYVEPPDEIDDIGVLDCRDSKQRRRLNELSASQRDAIKRW
ncbi:MAG: hypothetical protein ACYSTL_06725, partial [Planctomycetota bacterium]